MIFLTARLNLSFRDFLYTANSNKQQQFGKSGHRDFTVNLRISTTTALFSAKASLVLLSCNQINRVELHPRAPIYLLFFSFFILFPTFHSAFVEESAEPMYMYELNQQKLLLSRFWEFTAWISSNTSSFAPIRPWFAFECDMIP